MTLQGEWGQELSSCSSWEKGGIWAGQGLRTACCGHRDKEAGLTLRLLAEITGRLMGDKRPHRNSTNLVQPSLQGSTALGARVRSYCSYGH